MLGEIELILRPAEAKDVESIAEIEKICFATPWTADAVYKEITSNPIAHYVIAEIGGVVTGYVGFWQILDEGHITNVAVKPGYRNRHIGNGIIQVLIDFTVQEGIMHHTL